jgi:hypothetical protein
MLFRTKKDKKTLNHGILRSDNNGAIIEPILPVALKRKKMESKP